MASGVTYWAGALRVTLQDMGDEPERVRIACNDASMYMSQAEAIALRDQIADALTQASIQRDARQDALA